MHLILWPGRVISEPSARSWGWYVLKGCWLATVPTEQRALLNLCPSPGCRLGISGGQLRARAAAAAPGSLWVSPRGWGSLPASHSALTLHPVSVVQLWGFPCLLQTQQWHWAGSPVSSILRQRSRGAGKVTFLSLALAAQPTQAMRCWLWHGGDRAMLQVSVLPHPCTPEGGEAPGSLFCTLGVTCPCRSLGWMASTTSKCLGTWRMFLAGPMCP